MDSLVLYAVVLAVLAAFLWHVARQDEFFRVSIRKGRVLVIRGRIPAGYLADLRDVGRHVERGTVRAVKDSGGALLVLSASIDGVTAQRMRNSFSLYPVVKLRAAPPLAHPNIGQVLGIEWLAWRLAPPIE
ncbi:DUF3634 family protein [Pendulispora brunnea]|uniref:DUF3634 family protein n=1 Tax=Pendulispora brunnea TaxID=2905690 RepID=A0ABZ2KMN4_9BACT